MDQRPQRETSETLDFDGRLFRLEKISGQHRDSLVTIQGALLDQMGALAILEVAIAVLLAMALYQRYRETTTKEDRDGPLPRP